MRRALFISLAAMVCWTAPPALGGPWEDCAQERNPDLAFSGCSRLIDEGGRRSGARLAEAYAFRARAGAKLRRYDQASSDAADAIRLSSDGRIRSVAHGARSTAAKGKADHPQALKDAQKAVESDSSSAAAYAHLATALNDLKRHSDAQRAAAQALALDGDLAFARRALATALNGLGNASEALSQASAAVSLNPQDPANYAARGWINYKRRRWDQAVADYDAALRIDPDDHEILNNRSVVNRRLGRLDAAARDASQAIQLMPDWAPPYNNRAAALILQSDFDGATRDAERSIALQSGRSIGHNYKAAAYLGLDRYDAALRSADTAFQESNRTSSFAQANRALALLKLGRTYEALNAAEEAVRIGREQAAKTGEEEDPWSYRARAEVRFASGQNSQAMADYDESLRLEPNNPLTRAGRGDLRKANGDGEGAIEDYDVALKVDPSLRRVAESRRAIQREAQEKIAREKALKDKLALDAINASRPSRSVPDKPAQDDDAVWKDCVASAGPDRKISGCALALDRGFANTTELRLRAHALRAGALLEKDKPDAAIPDYDKAIDINGRDPALFEGRAAARLKLKRCEEAVADAAEAIRLAERKRPEGFALRADAYACQNEFDLALRDFDAFTALKPAPGSVHLKRGHIRLSRGEADLALDDLNKAVQAFPNDPEALEARGRASAMKNDHARALADFEAALAKKPNFAKAAEGSAQARAALSVEQAWENCSRKPQDDGVILACGEVVARSPERRARAYALRGDALIAKDDPENALDNYEKALGVDDALDSAKAGRDKAKQALAFKAAQTECGRSQDFAARIAACSIALAREGESPERRAKALLARAEAYGLKEDFDRALADSEAALALDPKSAVGHRTQALAHLSRKAYDLAADAAGRAIELDARDGAAFLLRGDSYAGRGDDEKAVADYEKARDVSPALKPVADERRARVGERLAAEGWKTCGAWTMPEEALSGCGRAIEWGEKDSTERRALARAERASAYDQIGRFDEALADLDAAVALAPNDAALRARRGSVHLNKRAPDKALADFEDALRHDKTLQSALEGLEKAKSILAAEQAWRDCNRKADSERAVAGCTVTIERGPAESPERRARAFANRAAAHSEKKSFDLALADAAEAIRLDGRNAAAFAARAAALLGLDRGEEALADLDQALRRDPSLASAWLNRGLARLRKGELDRAIADLSEAVRRDPDSLAALLARSEAHEKKKDLARAIEDLDQVLRRDPSASNALLARGGLHLRKGDPARAAADFDKAAALDRTQPRAFLGRAEAHYAAGNLDAAFEAATEANRLDPNAGAALEIRGAVHLRRTELGQALEDLDAAVRLDPGSARARHWRGEVHLGKRELDRAFADMNDAVVMKPDDAVYLEGRGQVQVLRRDLAGAREDFEAALKRDPSFAKARVGLDEVLKLIAPDKTPPSTPSEVRIALLIGNSNYLEGGSLANPEKDVKAVEAALQEAGFLVTTAFDLKRDAFLDALGEFETQAEKADWALIYFAGHGIEMEKKNYLIPVDAKLTRPTDVKDKTIPLDRVMETLEKTRKLRIVILDACRNTPFKTLAAARSFDRGLARYEPPGVQNTMVLYAAAEGQVAEDGTPGENSPFVKAFAQWVREPGMEVGDLHRYVRDDVLKLTKSVQLPYSYVSISRERFYFRPPKQ